MHTSWAMPKTCSALIVALTMAVAASGVFASPAAAHYEYLLCLSVLTVAKGDGGFKNSTCTEAGGSREYAIATPTSAGLLFFCLWNSGKKGVYKEGRCQESGSPFEYEWFKSDIGVQRLVGESGKSIIKTKVSGVEVEVECSSDKFTTTPLPEGESTEGRIEFSGCVVRKPANCAVGTPLTAEFNDTIGETESHEPTELMTGDLPEGESTFLEFELKNKEGATCALKGTKIRLSGMETCEYDGKITLMEDMHEIICKASGSSLKYGSEPSSFEGTEKVKTENGDPWGIS